MTRKTPATLRLEDVSGLTPTEQAGRLLRQWIEGGELPPGKRLPSERELASKLGLSRAAVRVALSELEAGGLLRCAPRSGRVVASKPVVADSVLSSTVALLVPPGFSPQFSPDNQPGWSSHIYRGVIETLFQNGVGVLMLSSQDLEAQLDKLTASPPRAVVVLDEPLGLSTREKLLECFHVGEIPVVAYGDLHAWPGCDTVTSDHEGGAYALTRWVLAQGRRRLLRCHLKLTPPPDWSQRRDAGFTRALAEAGLPVLPAVELPKVAVLPDAHEHFQMMARLCAGYLAQALQGPERADAILVHSDGELFTLAAGCRLLGLDPQRDLLFAGYDNYWRDCYEHKWETATPRVTVDKQNALIGRSLAELLLDRLAGRLPPEPQQRVVAPRLIVESRNS